MEKFLYSLILVYVLVFHIPMSIFSSVEVLDYPLWSKFKKIMCIIMILLIPIIGAKIVHKKIGLKLKGNNKSDGDPYPGGADID